MAGVALNQDALMPSDESDTGVPEIANELIRMLTKRLAAGAPPSAVAEGVAVGLALIGRHSPEGQALINTIAACLQKAE